ncbi:MAG: 30S ribosomal protein S6 [Lachnospiraceae bacterium]|jgi:small subunit ribosomal protein S6|nr:30S ribosomal protein S6 [Lachnospiraceae bacterium]
MNKYELALVISSNVEEDVKLATLDKAKALIERFGGVITNVDDAGKKKLAYEIQKMREGFYYFVKFDAEPTAPAEIESRIRIQDNVLRYLIVSDTQEA